MAAARCLGPLLVAIVAAFACASAATSGSDAPPIEAGSSDLFELVARFQGPYAQLFGTPHEWWSPRTGFYRAENGVDDHIRYTVEVRSVLTLSEARARGLLRPLTGRLAGTLKQSRPGTRPHFGQAGYWFGRAVGKARAATLLEQRGGDPVRGDERGSGATYTTIYRFPGARVPDYPGLGPQGPSDIRVECRPRPKDWLPGVSAGAKPRPVRLADGTAAKLYMEPYTQGNRSGVSADIVVGRTACFIHGLIAPRDLVRLAPTFRRA